MSEIQGNHLIQNLKSLAQTDHVVKMPFVRLSHKSRSNDLLKSAPGRAEIPGPDRSRCSESFVVFQPKSNTAMNSSIRARAGRNVEPQHLFVDLSTELLRTGMNISFQASGWSMHPTIKDGETITVKPIAPEEVKKGDIILYRSQNGVIAHRVVEKQQAVGSPQSSALSPQSPNRVQGFEESRVQVNHSIRNPKSAIRNVEPQSSSLTAQSPNRIQGFEDSRIQKYKDSRIQGFK